MKKRIIAAIAAATMLAGSVNAQPLAGPSVVMAASDNEAEEPELDPYDISHFAYKVSDMGYTGKAVKPTAQVALVNDKQKPLKQGTDYKITGYKNNIKAGKNTAIVVVKGMGKYTGKAELQFTITKDLIGGDFSVKITNEKSGAVISWSKAKNAKKYIIYKKTDGKWKEMKRYLSNVTSLKDTSVKKANGKYYQYKVAAVPNRKSGQVEELANNYRLKHPVLQKPIISRYYGKRPSVYWVSNKKSDGYQVQFKKGSKVYRRKIKGGKKAGCKMPKQWKAGMNVRVRCYKKVKGKVSYSAWSNWKPIAVY